jgi:hypothetical protein
MAFQRHLLYATVLCFFTFASHGQSPAWNSLRYGKISLHYPPTWHVNKEAPHAGQSRLTLTPDSMQNLTMKIIEIYELTVSGDHTYARFKNDFASMLQSRSGMGTKVLKTEEISFKGHKTMYAETIQSSLPAKVYGINAGTEIYPIILIQRRYSNIPDPRLEQDEMAILNSITIAQ